MTSLQLYVGFTMLLALNLVGLWAYSGSVRGKTKTTPNEEDGRTILQGSTVTADTPEAVQRVLRAHANAMASIVPFLFLAELWIRVAAPSAMLVAIVCGGFTFVRFSHSFAYVKGIQPWRSIFFVFSGLATLAVFVLLGIATFAGSASQ
jgi:uncharacterized MAPEG superfamily protein